MLQYDCMIAGKHCCQACYSFIILFPIRYYSKEFFVRSRQILTGMLPHYKCMLEKSECHRILEKVTTKNESMPIWVISCPWAYVATNNIQ